MTESNLPPGTATSDIPGNSSRDMAWERLWENWSDEFRELPNRLRAIAQLWDAACVAYNVEKRTLEAILGELDTVISEMDRCAELIPCEEDLEPEEPEYDPCP